MNAFFFVETYRLLRVGCALDRLRGIGLSDERVATVFRFDDDVIVLFSTGTSLLLHCAYFNLFNFIGAKGKVEHGKVDFLWIFLIPSGRYENKK